MTGKRLTKLGPVEENNFAIIAKLDGYLDEKYDFYMKFIGSMFKQTAESFGDVGEPSDVDMVISVGHVLIAKDTGLYDYLDRKGFPVRDPEKYKEKVMTFSKVIIGDAQARGRV